MTGAATVVAVDDDPLGLKYCLSTLRGKFQMMAATGVDDALSLINSKGLENVDCVLADYCMPGKNGLELLSWLRQRDPTLSIIMITGIGDTGLAKEVLRKGGYDFLDKPVTSRRLAAAVERAVRETKRRRLIQKERKGLRDAARLCDTLLAEPALPGGPSVSYTVQNVASIGGDLVVQRRVGEGRYAYVLGDVSGHDIKAGFASAYLRGLIHGLLESEASLAELFSGVNHSLRRNWVECANRPAHDGVIPTSLCALGVVCEQETGSILFQNHGMPPLYCVGKGGWLCTETAVAPPLGWTDCTAAAPQCFSACQAAALLAFSDGVTGIAAEAEICPVGLAHRLLEDREATLAALRIQPQDDFSIMKISLIDDSSTDSGSIVPLVCEHYHGGEVEDIDRLQRVWRRSVQFGVGTLKGERLHNMLLCCREAVLNALVHGCDGEPGKFCTFQIRYVKDRSLVEVRVDDPGHGHDFDPAQRRESLRCDQERNHMGLAIIQKFSDQFAMLNDGTSVVFAFHVEEA